VIRHRRPALCLVELRGFEPLTPCMPSRDPHHGIRRKALRSRAFHHTKKAGAWWLMWLHRAWLLRCCCAHWLEPIVDHRPLGFLQTACTAGDPGGADHDGPVRRTGATLMARLQMR
jgi:hypothetical protein